MADSKNIKAQRDKFLAFSFASADLFLEVAENGEIAYARGAAKTLTGIDHETLPGRSWLDLFSREDRPVLVSLRKRAKDAERRGPIQVNMQEEFSEGRPAIVTAIKMPDNPCFYVTVGFPSEMMMKMAGIVGEQEKAQLLDKDDFLHTANEAFDMARSMGEGLDLTLLDIPNAAKVKERIGADLWGQFTESVTQVLSASSIDGQSAAQISDGRYSVIHDKNIDSDTLRNQLSGLSKDTDPDGDGFTVESKTVSADLESLSERETARALIYTINEFERKGASLNIESLNSGFKAYVSANAQKIHQFKTMVEQLSFTFDFQPIVDLEAMTLSHFEILSRFNKEGSTQEWIIFGEDIGMAANFDIAVCERVINYLLYKAANNRMKFAMNLSGQSMQNEQFFRTLTAKLDMHPDLAKRMIFEITESTTIQELDMVNHFIQTLQAKGYKVCLDDFGARSASFQYLNKLHVDYIKIDGQYTRKILNSHRDQVLIKNLSQLCKDLNIQVIAERIEEKEQMEMMKRLGATLGQGFYFGYPLTRPQFDPDKIPVQKQ